jgi:hypothetical protein
MDSLLRSSPFLRTLLDLNLPAMSRLGQWERESDTVAWQRPVEVGTLVNPFWEITIPALTRGVVYR